MTQAAASGALYSLVQRVGREPSAAGVTMSALDDRALAAPPFVFEASSSA